MIYEFTYTGLPQKYLIVSETVPPALVGYFLVLMGAFGIVWFWNHLRKGRIQNLDNIILLTCSVVLLGVYIFSFRWIDEVFVNLEHPYNLFHHGRFSYSPNQMIEGTVEFIYYLLMTPFAWTKKLLIQGAYIQGFIIAWLHLFVLWRLFGRRYFSLKFFSLLLFTLALPLHHVLANGFGNGLVSLLFLIALYFQLKQQPTRALWIAALFPLVRPDAILYSFSILLVDAIIRRRVRWKFLLGAIASTLVYMSLVKLFYGDWVPTPVAFKSFKLSMLPLVNWMEVLWRIQFWIFNPYHLLFLALLVASFFLPVSNKIRQLRFYTSPLAAIFLFYSITSIGFLFFMIYDGRYFVGLEVYSIVFPLLVIWDLKDNQFGQLQSDTIKHDGYCPHYNSEVLLFRRHRNPLANFAVTPIGWIKEWRRGFEQVVRQRYLVPLALLLIVAIYLASANLAYRSSQPTPWHSKRTDWLGVSGQITDRLVPEDWTISNTELNTFGFMMHDRDVIDLWGYTNPAIANSRICNQMRIRVNPDFFLQTQPDVFAWWFITRSGSRYELRLQGSSMGKSFSQLGDVTQVLSLYDVFFLNDPNYERSFPIYISSTIGRHITNFEGVTLLIKKEHTPEFLQILDQEKFRMFRTRELDMQAFRKMYDAQKKVTHYCG